MFKKALLAIGLIGWLAYGLAPVTQVQAQNTTCSDRPEGDSSNACANTRFVMTNGGGSAVCTLFSDIATGCVPASGGGTLNYLRADGVWAQPPGTIPVGGVLPWAGGTVPPGYLLAFGQAISRSTFSQLYNVLTIQETVNCTIGSPTVSVAIGTSDRIGISAKVEGTACFPVGTLVASKGSGTLTMNANATASTSTSIRLFLFGNGDGSTTFNIPDLMGRTVVGRDNMSGSAAGRITTSVFGPNADSMNGSGGAQTQTLVTGNLPAYTPTGTVGGSVTINDPGHAHTYSRAISAGFPKPNDFGTDPFITYDSPATSTNTTGITITGTALTFSGAAQGGASTAFSVLQPSLTLDYVIKAFDTDATVANLVVGTTVITGGSNGSVLYDNGGILGEYALAAYLDMYQGTANNKLVTPSVIWPPEVVITYGTTTTIDMSMFRDAVITLTGNITTMTLTNVTVGKAGSITFIQDGSGNHTTVFDTKFKFAGGTLPVLTTTAGAVDIMSYQCRTSTFCFAAMMNDVK